MKVALRELVRRPGRFAFAGATLALLTLVLLLLGGLLDGLFLGSTGAVRAQDAEVFVYSADARDSILRSRIDPVLRAEVEAVGGVDETAGLGIALVAAHPPDAAELLDASVIGYEVATGPIPAPPPPGAAHADDRLRRQGVDVGDRLLVGPAEIPVQVVDFVDDSSYLLQGGLWVEPATWRAIQSSSRPSAAVGDDVFQVLLVSSDSLDPEMLARAIDEATGGATSSLTRDEAILSLPGTVEQTTTFTFLISLTFFVVGLVTALFFVLITLERTRLIASMKALGVPTSRIVHWSVVQAVVVAVGAFLAGGAATVPLASLLASGGVPVQLEPGRSLATFVILVTTAAAGSLFTLSRTIRIDPASAIS